MCLSRKTASGNRDDVASNIEDLFSEKEAN